MRSATADSRDLTRIAERHGTILRSDRSTKEPRRLLFSPSSPFISTKEHRARGAELRELRDYEPDLTSLFAWCRLIAGGVNAFEFHIDAFLSRFIAICESNV